MISDKEIKKKVKPLFFSNFERFYPVQTLKELGFNRYVCKKCGRAFWSVEPREVCGDCEGEYSFIGNKNAVTLDYPKYWNLFVDTFKEWGYKPINRYPVVARWLPNIDFVFAGINIFQPYAVSGEVEPPEPMTLEPQFCLRFNDIDNVGVTGRHYTGFIMIGQHVFNTPNKFYYFKDEGVKQMIEFFTKSMRIPITELVLHEDVWAGGGNFGPSIEFFSKGLELANQVFMQYEQTENGYRELQTKVIDMGAGHERWAWYAHGSNTSYDVVFPNVLKYLYSFGKPKLEYMRYFSQFNFEEGEAPWGKVAKEVGISVGELKKEVAYASAIYSIADHTRTILVAIHDGAIPSNVGGGYNLRNILRRVFSFIDKYKLDIDLMKVFEIQMKEFGKWYGLHDVPHLHDIIEIERKRYLNTIEKGRRMVKKIKNFDESTLIKLYDSNGITPEMVKEINPSVEVPSDFYAKISEMHKNIRKKEKKFDTEGIPKTNLLFYENDHKFEFNSRIIKIVGDYLVLDSTYFYPRGGGQDYDTGEIEGVKVVEVLKQDGVVFHKVADSSKFKLGQEVHCKVDENRRRILTVHHSAVHVLGYAIKKVLGDHALQAGSEKTVEKARLDVVHYKGVSFEERQEIEKIANDVIKRNLPVEKFFMNRTEAEKKYGMYIYAGGAVPGKILRIVKIDDLDVQACGGTHVDNTGEIKAIKIINVEKVKDGVVRFEIVAGDLAIEKFQELEKILNELSEMWNIKYNEIPKTAKKFFEEWKEQRKELRKLKEELVELKLNMALNSKDELVKINLPIEFSHAFSLIKSVKTDKALIIFTEDGNGIGKGNDKINIANEMKKYFEKVEGDSNFAKGFKAKN